jgi:hypothetical protein
VRAARAPIRREHEVIDDQLAAALEQLRKCLFSVSAIKDIGLFNFRPRQLAPHPVQLIPLLGELLLFDQQRLACGQPFLW